MRHERSIDQIEAHWPRFDEHGEQSLREPSSTATGCPPSLEKQSSSKTHVWGEMQQGRIPAALVADDEPNYLSVLFATEAARQESDQLLNTAAAKYNDLFDRVLQF